MFINYNKIKTFNTDFFRFFDFYVTFVLFFLYYCLKVMRESTTKDFNSVAANEASTSKTIKYLKEELDDQTFIEYSEKCVIDKKFDDFCFKTPMLPHKFVNF